MAAEPPQPDVPERDAALLLDMLQAAQDALSFVSDIDYAGFAESRLHQSAVIRALGIIGEAAGKVSVPTRAAQARIPWRSLTGLRNRLIHDYAAVDINVVWRIVQEDLPELLQVLGPLVPSEDDS